MRKTTYKISKMDCPGEETLIRMKLHDETAIIRLEFDLAGRTLTIYHERSPDHLTSKLESLQLGSSLIQTVTSEDNIDNSPHEHNRQRKTLWIVLAINFGFFLLKMSTGIISNSMGLVADSLDMLADAFVYGMSLMAVGAILARKKRVALWSGIIQIILALSGLCKVIKRFIGIELMPISK